ncbi:ABC transporter substrate-binding protein [Desulfopila sp. IMCC35008]|uniref:ABC transporter substrate-binding protein n=1 Tax=Desulfopila sp. IMCC35008 TaxID=2653858 RepID=UPI0013D86904|nr:ABC transporter substrate-binding protein [Desulfopila sp. IMCC35008]
MNRYCGNSIILILLVIIGLLAGCENESLPEILPSGKTVRIGVIAPISGVDESIGKNGLAGIKAALQVQPYLLNGDKIDIVLEDDGSDANLTVAAAKKLVHQEKVAAILVLSRSSSVLALSELADTLETPFLALISSHPLVTNTKWAAQLIFDDESQGIISALYVRDELLMDSVTVFKQIDDLHSVFLADQFVMKFKESGGRVRVVGIGDQNIGYKELLEGLSPQEQNFFYMPIDASQVLQIEKATRELGMQPQVMVSDGVAGNILLQFEDDVTLLNGMMAVDVFSNNAKKTEYGRLMEKSFNENFQEPGTTLAALGCEGMSYLLMAMQKCGDSTDRECIKNKIRSHETFMGFSGAFRIKTNGKIERPVFINLIDDGKLKNIVKIY